MNLRRFLTFTILSIVWLTLCWLVVAYQPFTLRVALIVVMSWIIIFVPVIKKYGKGNKTNNL